MKRRWLIALLCVMMLSPGVLAQDDGITFPIATHYPDFGDGQAAPKRGEVEQVAYGVYNNRVTDYYAPSREKVNLFVGAVMAATELTPVRIYNDIAGVVEDIDALQIINNVPVEGALYTIFLPPGWTRDGSYPVVLSGNGAGTSNNRRLYGGTEVYAPVIAWHSVQDGGHGLILAISNCGGTESQGVDEPTLRSVGAFFDFIAAYGGDKHNAVTTGGSRGGGTALVWAANRLELDYTVRAVFAHVPPTHYGSLGETSIMTYPALGSIAELVLGKGAYRFHQGPDTMETRLPKVLEILLGTGDVEEANALGPVGLAERLAGKQIVLTEGTHDSFFQLALFLAFDRRLTELGIDHATAIVLGDGHEISTWAYEQTLNYLRALVKDESYTVPTGRHYFIKTGEGQIPLEDFLGAPVEALPFVVQLPAHSAVNLPIDVSACGAPGASWSITMTGPSGEVVWDRSGVFDESECATFHLSTPEETGTYVWSFTYAGEEIPATNTPFHDENGCGVPAVTVVSAEQPSLSDTFYRPGDKSFGIDQFIAEGAHCDE